MWSPNQWSSNCQIREENTSCWELSGLLTLSFLVLQSCTLLSGACTARIVSIASNHAFQTAKPMWHSLANWRVCPRPAERGRVRWTERATGHLPTLDPEGLKTKGQPSAKRVNIIIELPWITYMGNNSIHHTMLIYAQVILVCYSDVFFTVPFWDHHNGPGSRGSSLYMLLGPHDLHRTMTTDSSNLGVCERPQGRWIESTGQPKKAHTTAFKRHTEVAKPSNCWTFWSFLEILDLLFRIFDLLGWTGRLLRRLVLPLWDRFFWLRKLPSIRKETSCKQRNQKQFSGGQQCEAICKTWNHGTLRFLELDTGNALIWWGSKRMEITE